jgi:hypothetical protein
MRGKSRQTVKAAMGGVYDRKGHFRGWSRENGEPKPSVCNKKGPKKGIMEPYRTKNTPEDLGTLGELIPPIHIPEIKPTLWERIKRVFTRRDR